MSGSRRIERKEVLWVAAAAAAVLAVAVGGARAELIFSEPFLSGANPAAGEYAPDQPLIPSGGTGQDPTVPGFTGPWRGHTAPGGTNTIRSRSTAPPGGPPYATGGSAQYLHTASIDERQIYRELAPYTSGHDTYYISGVMTLDPGFNTAGNAMAMTKLLGIDGSGTYGMRWGFDADGSEVDAVINFRDPGGNTTYVLQNGVAPGAHRFLMQIEQNDRSDFDRVQVWLDPDLADLTSRKLVRGDTASWDDALKPVDRLYLNAAYVGANTPVHYDEVRFGTTWADAAPDLTPNPILMDEGFSGADGTRPPGWVVYSDNPTRLIATNDGNGEYQLKKVESPAGGPYLISHYDNDDDTARGKWRDVTLVAKTRFSGGAQNENGVIFRAGDITSQSGSGDFYHARVSGSDLQLYRFVNGTAALLGETPLSGYSHTGGDNWYRISVENIPNPGTDQVHIVAELFKNGTFTDLAGRIDVVDTASNAITRPGSVGFRSYTFAGSNTRAVFDDLMVVTNNARLLWYDDYSDGQAPHMQSYGNKTQNVTGGKYQFQGGSQEGIGFVDMPAITSQGAWANVEARTLMRMGGNGLGLAGGLIVRATGITDPGAGSNTSTGDLYMYRLQRSGTDRAQLYRRNDGAFTLLDEINLGFDIPSSENLFLRFAVEGDANVRLLGQASLYEDFRDVFGEISYVDSSPDRILGPGSAGFRAYGGGTINFDNFSVTAVTPIPEPVTMIGLLAGGAVLGGYLRRRRR